MHHIFISYSRKDLDFAQKIVDALAEGNLDTWIDWKSIPKGEDWEQEIYIGIEEADAFLFLISPDSVASEMCNKEIAHAVKNGKRILPIVVRDTDRKIIHPEISKRNWIFCRDGKDDFNKAIQEVRTTIHTDYEWLKYHTELQVKALKWEQTKDHSRLLRGKELREAEQAVGAASKKDPSPTDPQRDYVLASQRNEVRQRRQIAIGLGFGLAIVTVLVVFAWYQRNNALTLEAAALAEANAKATALVNEESARATAQVEKERAEEQANIVRAGELAAKALDLQHTNTIVSFLISVEAFNLVDNFQTRMALYSNANAYPQIVRFLPGGSGNVMAYSPDGRVIVSTNKYANALKLWDPTTGYLLQSMDQTGKSINVLSFSPDSKWLTVGNSTGLDLWTLSNGQITESRHIADNPAIRLAFSPNGRILATGSSDNFVTLWDVSSGHKICSVELVNSAIALAFHPSGRMWASSDLYSIALWDNSCKMIEFPTKYHPGSPADLTFSPDGKNIVFSYQFNGDYKVMFLDTASGDVLQVFDVDTFVDRLAFQPNTAILAVGSRDGNITLWDTATGKVVKRFVGQEYLFENLSFNPDGTMLASISFGGDIILWKLVESSPDRILQDTDVIAGVAFSPDGRTLASGTRRGTITLWDLATGKAIHTFEGHRTTTVQLSFSPDGSVLTSVSDDDILIEWDLVTRQPIRMESDHHQQFPDFTPDGKYLLYMPGNSSIILIDSSTGKPFGQPMTVFTNRVEQMAFSPDAKLLATAGDNGKVMLWDLATTMPVLSLTGHIGAVSRVAFSPDSTMLASGGTDKTIRLWDIDPQAWLSNVCDRVGRNFTQAEWQQYFPGESYRITCPQWPAGE